MIGPKTVLTLKRYTETLSGTGATIKTWSVVKNVTGALVTLSGNERFMALKKAVINTHKFYMNYRSDLSITEKDIFILGARTFEITDTETDPLGQNRMITCDLWEVK